MPNELGASIVKYTTPLPCNGLSDSDTKLFTNFEFCEGTNHKHLKNTLIHKAKLLTLTQKNNPRKV